MLKVSGIGNNKMHDRISYNMDNDPTGSMKEIKPDYTHPPYQERVRESN